MTAIKLQNLFSILQFLSILIVSSLVVDQNGVIGSKYLLVDVQPNAVPEDLKSNLTFISNYYASHIISSHILIIIAYLF